MHLHSDRTFLQCLYCHYDQRIQDPKLPEIIREQFRFKQLQLADEYFQTFLPLQDQLFTKLLNYMHNPQQVPVDTDVIRHMAAIIEKKIQDNQPVFINSNAHRITLTDQSGTILAWCKSNS